MEAFRKEIYQIATETGRRPEEMIIAAIDKIGEGMSDTDVFATLRAEGKVATASFTQDFAKVSGASLKMKRQLGIDTADLRKTYAGLHLVMKGKGALALDDFLESSESLMRRANEMGMKGTKAAIELGAAAKTASMEMSVYSADVHKISLNY